MNLQSLIHNCKTGDRKAQKTLFEGFSKTFLRLSFRYLNDRQYAEDACLEAFTLIFEGLKHFEYQSEAQTEAWMKRIVVNQSLKILRKTKTLLYQQIPEDDFVESNEIGVEDDLSGRELLQLILHLPDGYRAVFNMYVVEGYSHTEIAQILNISEGTSRSQLFKAKAMMKQMIGKYDGVPTTAVAAPSVCDKVNNSLTE
jgi:RNA polymerase sigma factor (sigma-70 family)